MASGDGLGGFVFVVSGLVLLVGDVFHPVHRFAVELFLNGEVRHGRGRCSAMPMFFSRRKPNDVAWPDFLDRASLALSATAARYHDQGLTEWMRVPRGASARLERDARGRSACGIFGLD